MTQPYSVNNLTYETSELKLAALFISEIPESSFEVYTQPNSIRKTIKIAYPQKHKDLTSKLEQDFINKQAITNVYSYNKALNQIRDRLRGKSQEQKWAIIRTKEK